MTSPNMDTSNEQPNKDSDPAPPDYEPPTNPLCTSPLAQATTAAMRLWLVQWFATHGVSVAGLETCFARLAWTGRWITTQPAERLEDDLRSWGFDDVHAHMIVADLEAQKEKEFPNRGREMPSQLLPLLLIAIVIALFAMIAVTLNFASSRNCAA